MSQTSQDFAQFMKQREDASSDFVVGNVTTLDELSVQASPATLFPPTGNCVEGAEQVNSGNAASSKFFKPGSTNKFEVSHMSSSGDLAYWVGVQRSVLNLEGQENPVPMDLRITEIFRREEGKWKLFHRHADALKTDAAA
jgi:ketosteroid isomerase-like protein